jgi:hypothetical protein
MEQSKDYLRGYSDGMADAQETILNQSLASRIKMLATNTLLLCMSISIVILFGSIVYHIMREIL